MIAVAISAFLLTPAAWLVREKALLRARQMQAAAYRQRAIVLGERARAELAAASRVLAKGAWETKRKGDSDPRAERGLWAAITVNHAVFRSGETRDLRIEFTLVNDGDKALDPQIGKSRIIVNGEELSDSGLILSNGPRDARFGALPPGATLQFGYALGKPLRTAGSLSGLVAGRELPVAGGRVPGPAHRRERVLRDQHLRLTRN